MSQSSTWNTLMVARDARLSGRPEVAAELMREIDEDLPAYSHLYARRVARRIDAMIGLKHDWLAWTGTHEAARLQSVLVHRRLMYFGSPRLTRAADGDGIEVRTRFWANYVVDRPYAFFPDLV